MAKIRASEEVKPLATQWQHRLNGGRDQSGERAAPVWTVAVLRVRKPDASADLSAGDRYMIYALVRVRGEDGQSVVYER